MKVTPKLLEKYYNGSANAQEKALVELWLQNEDALKDLGFPSQLDEDAVRASMWQNITLPAPSSLRLKRLKLVYRIAACLTFIIFGYVIVTVTNVFSRTVALSNRHTSGQQRYMVEGIGLTLAAQSQCEVIVPLWGPVKEVHFQGAVLITNSTGGKQMLDIRSEYKRCPQKPLEHVKLKEGAVYVALLDRNCQMISATLDELRDGIPRNFSTPLMQKFKLSI